MLDHKGPPPVISGFTYLERLGAGGYSTVYLFEQHMPRREVAVKVMNADVEDKTASRFESEANLMARVSSHPAILSIYGAGVSADGHPFLVMEYCPPPQLGAILRQGPLNVAETLSTAIQIAGAVETAHRAGIVHRDIKPANILLAATGAGRPHAYLTDFGIAVEIGGPRLTETNLVIGTPGYIAPEQQRGEVTTASDLFALGVLGEFMLTAQLEGHAPATERPADVPEVLWSLLVDLRAEAPDDRPDASAALARLQVHDLAWTPDAVGDVEVLRQVGAPGEIDAELTTMTALRDEPGAEPGAGVEAPPAAGAKRSSRVPLLLGGFGVLAVVAFVGVLLLWSPWTGEEPHQPPSATTSSTSEPSDEDPATSEATDETPTEEDPTSSTTSPTSGSVSVGTVVTRVGQECQYSDVGLRETTSDGTDVVCRLGDDGDYTWERDES